MKRFFFYSIAGVAAFVSTSEIGRANDQTPKPVGLLTCDVTSQISDVLKAKQDVACRYIRSSDQAATPYVGHIIDQDIDFGEIEGGQMTWRVFSTASEVNTLVGTYQSARAPASLKLPADEKVLEGDREDSALLEPHDMPGRADLNFSDGISALTLRE